MSDEKERERTPPIPSGAEHEQPLRHIASPPPSRARSTVRPCKPLLLIVDDDADIRKLLRSLLSPSYRLIEATNGLEAQRMVEQRPPHVIVSDVMMPLVSGVELAAWLKSSPVLRHIPIILVTARADNEAVASGLDVGADEYLVKPFSPKELIARVRSMVRLYQSYQELAAEKAEIARRSGMAQVSMGVLHSVGNTLSSAAVTLDLMQERLSKPKTSRLRRALDEIFQGAEGRGGAPPSERDGSLRQYVFMVLEAMEREGEEARADAQRLRERLDAIRDAIRAQEEYAYRNAYRTERLPLHDIVEESLSACGTDLVTAHIAVRLDLRPVDDVVANRHDLLTILHNLLDNARAAVAERGEEDGWIEISTWQERDKICCAVEDSGPGVPQDLRLKVFGYGFTTKPGASGIGLHFAGLRMKSVGGSISFADGRGPGARVVLTFPAGAREEMLAI